MTGSDDGNAELVSGTRELVSELVDLGDGLLQVPLVDLVGGHGGGHGVGDHLLLQRTLSLTWATHLSDCRYASDFGRRRISAERSERRNSSGPSNRRMRTAPVPTPGRTWASEPAPWSSRYLRAKRSASSLKDSRRRRAL